MELVLQGEKEGGEFAFRAVGHGNQSISQPNAVSSLRLNESGFHVFGKPVGVRPEIGEHSMTFNAKPKIGDEFGKRLGTTQLHDKLHFHHMVKVYDDWGEIIGTETLKHPISAHNIRGFRFYETWHFLKRNPCPVKKVKYVVPLVGSWDEDGNFAGLNPLAFAIEMP